MRHMQALRGSGPCGYCRFPGSWSIKSQGTNRFLCKGCTMTQSQAFTKALILAIVAPDDDKAQLAIELAQSLSIGLTKKTVDQCKKQAMQALETL